MPRNDKTHILIQSDKVELYKNQQIMAASYKINSKIVHKIISAEKDIIERKTVKINLKDLWILKDLK